MKRHALILLVSVACAATAFVVMRFVVFNRIRPQTVPGVSLTYDIIPPSMSLPMPGLSDRVAEVLKRRVDPDSARNLIWLPQGQTRLEVQLPLSQGPNSERGGDADYSAADLKRLLKGAGVLEFHILWDQGTPSADDDTIAKQMIERFRADGPIPKPGDTMRWYEVDDANQMRGRFTEKWQGKIYGLVYITPGESIDRRAGGKPWGLERVSREVDQYSGNVMVEFQFNPQGALLFGELTGTHLKKPLAIVLDGKIISAPTIRSRIEGHGNIWASTDKEIDYLVRTLSAGALPARLSDEPIAEKRIQMEIRPNVLRAYLLSVLVGLLVGAGVCVAGYLFTATRKPPAMPPIMDYRSFDRR